MPWAGESALKKLREISPNETRNVRNFNAARTPPATRVKELRGKVLPFRKFELKPSPSEDATQIMQHTHRQAAS